MAAIHMSMKELDEIDAIKKVYKRQIKWLNKRFI